ncbi:hypothetical protein [Psychrobacter sp. K31L]|uniref:hypothetical protein n=1 Tax=Psychrobacter sp. K31L TaxID=2820758 RepID=UPI001B31B6D0|nr:hypothetical protein [Psychrobacter sp. K31L]MBP3947034.1 hypothetical protein [Psychrobacter sp. K31L]
MRDNICLEKITPTPLLVCSISWSRFILGHATWHAYLVLVLVLVLVLDPQGEERETD